METQFIPLNKIGPLLGLKPEWGKRRSSLINLGRLASDGLPQLVVLPGSSRIGTTTEAFNEWIKKHTSAATQPQRGRGRPRGSKDKTKRAPGSGRPRKVIDR